ncbi:MAG: hypothetical protein U0796_07940 [Gemmatales bacterium]
MAIAFGSNEDGRSRIVLTDEPDYIKPLIIGPSDLEHEIKQGNWLVIAMSIWSVFDIREGHRAIRFTKRYAGRFGLGLRPYDYLAEFATWLPSVKFEEQTSISVHNESRVRHVLMEGNRKDTPVWAVFKEGQLKTIELGCLTDDALEQLVTPLIAAA